MRCQIDKNRGFVMKLKTFIRFLKLRNQKNYHEFIKNTDAEKALAEEPLCISDKGYKNSELIETDIDLLFIHTEMHDKLAEKYRLHEVSEGKNDFERSVSMIKWLSENTFYRGIHLLPRSLKDNGLDILNYSYGKPFKKAINCRYKAIAFADCLMSVGIKAYPVQMNSSEFKSCHFTCHVYISEFNKWCAFDPSFGCWFTDKNGNILDLFEIRDMFLAGEKPVINGYSFNGTDECADVYIKSFLEQSLSNLSTWSDSSMNGRTSRRWKHKKKFQSKIPE